MRLHKTPLLVAWFNLCHQSNNAVPVRGDSVHGLVVCAEESYCAECASVYLHPGYRWVLVSELLATHKM